MGLSNMGLILEILHNLLKRCFQRKTENCISSGRFRPQSELLGFVFDCCFYGRFRPRAELGLQQKRKGLVFLKGFVLIWSFWCSWTCPIPVFSVSCGVVSAFSFLQHRRGPCYAGRRRSRGRCVSIEFRTSSVQHRSPANRRT